MTVTLSDGVLNALERRSCSQSSTAGDVIVHTDGVALFAYRRRAAGASPASSSTTEDKAWHLLSTSRSTSWQPSVRRPLLVADLGWSKEKAARVRKRLIDFEDAWNDPGMDAYADV